MSLAMTLHHIQLSSLIYHPRFPSLPWHHFHEHFFVLRRQVAGPVPHLLVIHTGMDKKSPFSVLLLIRSSSHADVSSQFGGFLVSVTGTFGKSRF